jgi:hypothetical protein
LPGNPVRGPPGEQIVETTQFRRREGGGTENSGERPKSTHGGVARRCSTPAPSARLVVCAQLMSFARGRLAVGASFFALAAEMVAFHYALAHELWFPQQAVVLGICALQ